jgi:hypothetical protein
MVRFLDNPEYTKIVEQIPEKSKNFFKRIRQDWDSLSNTEKAGIVVLAIATSPVIAGLAMDYFGRRKLKEVV